MANSSGTTHIVKPLAEEQARRGHDVRVLFVEKPPYESVIPDSALVESIKCGQSLPLANPGVSLEFAQIASQRIPEADVVHVHAVWNFPTYWAMRIARKSRIPYLVAPQGSFESWALGQNRFGKKLYGSLTELPLLKAATGIQALTNNEERQVRAMGIDAPVHVVPNGVIDGQFSKDALPLWQQIGLKEPTPTILFLSRLHPKKGIDVLLRAFALYSQAHRGILVVAGHDAKSGYRQTLENLAKDLGVADKVHFIGEVSGSKKEDVLAGADIFVLSSHSEGLPVAVVEAMAAGLPVVITDGCNIPEVEENGAGIVVDQNPEAIAASIQLLVSNSERRSVMSCHARALVKERFTWSAIAQSLDTVYGEMAT